MPHLITSDIHSNPMSREFGDCVAFDQDDNINIWFWLENATFTGKREFNGKQVDVWTYMNKVSIIIAT